MSQGKLSLSFRAGQQLEERLEYPTEDAALALYLAAHPHAAAHSGQSYGPCFPFPLSSFLSLSFLTRQLINSDPVDFFRAPHI